MHLDVNQTFPGRDAHFYSNKCIFGIRTIPNWHLKDTGSQRRKIYSVWRNPGDIYSDCTMKHKSELISFSNTFFLVNKLPHSTPWTSRLLRNGYWLESHRAETCSIWPFFRWMPRLLVVGFQLIRRYILSRPILASRYISISSLKVWTWFTVFEFTLDSNRSIFSCVLSSCIQFKCEIQSCSLEILEIPEMLIQYSVAADTQLMLCRLSGLGAFGVEFRLWVGRQWTVSSRQVISRIIWYQWMEPQTLTGETFAFDSKANFPFDFAKAKAPKFV